MTLEQRIFQVLTGSPLPAPSLGTRFYPNTAPQGAVYPYCVYSEISGNLLAVTQDQQAIERRDPREHRYQFSIFDQDYDRAALAGQQIEDTLVAIPREYPGVQSILPASNMWRFEAADRLHHRIIELMIIEDYPS